MTEWLNESLYPGWGQRFEVLDVLAREQSEYQNVLVVQTASHGRVLVLDGNVQITERDEFVYQEMIAHVPLLAHGSARRVLIIGAGDGGVLRRVLQHQNVELATMVEIDEAVIRLSKQFLPAIAGNAWSDHRANVVVGDGIAHVMTAPDDYYDVIIVDSTDPVGVGEPLFTASFYADCARVLGPNGLLVNQAGVPFMQAEELRDTTLRRSKSFAYVSAYLAAVPTYVGGFMALGIAGNKDGFSAVTADTIRSRAKAVGVLGTTGYWSPEIQVASFHLPPYVARCLPT